MGRAVILPIIALAVLAGLAAAQEESVRPGINDSFQDANVADFIGRFEKEGREAFDHRQEIIAECHLKPDMAVADIGAGTGLFTRKFASLVGPRGQVFAVDISDNFLRHIEEFAKKEDLANIVTVKAAPQTVNLSPNSVDLAFICDAYHHFEFPQKLLASIHRSLKTNGELILIDFHRVEGVSSDWVLNHVRAGQDVFVKEVEEAGFHQVDENKTLLKESYFVRFRKDRPAKPDAPPSGDTNDTR